MVEEKLFHTIIRKLCEEKDIKLEKLSFDWILQLTKNNKVRHITGSNFDLNPEASGHIACDKYATYQVLKSLDVSVIEHFIIFNPLVREKYIDDSGIFSIINEGLKNNKKVVIKPNFGYEGKGVYLCNNLKEAEIAVHKLFKNSSSLSMCPFYDIVTEFRTFYLDGKIHLIYGKTKPQVVGNGKDTLGYLISELNLPKKLVVEENVGLLDLDYVPKKDEVVYISWKHNLSGGATFDILKKGKLYSEIEDLALKAGKAMNLKFATIDIILTSDNNLYVLEVNSGIGTSIFINSIDGGYDLIKNIYNEAIDLLFKE